MTCLTVSESERIKKLHEGGKFLISKYVCRLCGQRISISGQPKETVETDIIEEDRRTKPPVRLPRTSSG